MLRIERVLEHSEELDGLLKHRKQQEVGEVFELGQVKS